MTTRHIACKGCRDRKIRCDGGQPSCQPCLNKNQPCVYQADSVRLEVSQTLKQMQERLGKLDILGIILAIVAASIISRSLLLLGLIK